MATSHERALPRARRTPTRWVITKVAVIAAVVTVVLGAGLAWQMTQGADPVLRPKAIAAAGQTQPTRRIVKTVVIRRVITSPRPGTATPASSGGSTQVSSAPAPVPVTTATS